MIYLDNNATTQTLPEVRDEMFRVMTEDYANPSSAHPAGTRSRLNMIQARSSLAEFIGASPEHIYFTSGATESNNIILQSLLKQNTNTRLITTQAEHSSIKNCANYLEGLGVEIVWLDIDGDGLISLDELQKQLQTPTTLVSIQWANNETGVIQPLEEAAEMCKQSGALFHSDISQAVGRIKVNLEALPIDFASFTGHKFHAPPGTGVLYTTSKKQLRPLFFGGSQETSFRPGTENMPSLVAMGCAASIRNATLETYQRDMKQMRDAFEAKVLERIPDVKVNGTTKHRLVNTSNLCFGGLDGPALVARLGQEGVMCSQSSACTNQRPEPSFVLRAMGLSEDEAYGSIRFSFGTLNSMSEVDKAVDTLASLCETLRAFHI